MPTGTGFTLQIGPGTPSLTPLGRAVAEREAEAMARLVDRARTVGLLRRIGS